MSQVIQRRPEHMFNDYRFPMPMSESPVDGAKYPARWVWDLGNNGKIYFKVNDGVFGAQDRNAKMKEVEMSMMDRNALFALMDDAINNSSFTKAQYHVKKVTFGNGGRMNEHPSTLGTFTIIRTQEGRINVGYSKGTYRVMFVFKSPFDSAVTVQKDGQAVEDAGLMSRLFAKAFIVSSAKFLDRAEIDNYKPRERKDNGGGNGGGNRGGNSWGNNGGGNGGNRGGNGGGGNNWGGNNGGGSSPSPRKPDATDFNDEDIDF